MILLIKLLYYGDNIDTVTQEPGNHNKRQYHKTTDNIEELMKKHLSVI